MKLQLVQDALVWLYIFLISIMLGATVYQMLVIVPEFTRDFPNGMITLSKSNIVPGNFWGSPILGLAILLAPIVSIAFNWKTPRRKWLLLAFGFGITASVYTSLYFIPRLRIMGLLDSPITTDIELLKITVNEWIANDKIRFWLVVVPGFACLLKAGSLSPSRIKTSKIATTQYETAVAV